MILEEEEIKCCLACPFAHQIINKYYAFLPKFTDYCTKEEKKIGELKEIKEFQKAKKINKNLKDLNNTPKEIAQLVESISKTLQIKGTFQKRCVFLKTLSNINLKYDDIISGLEDNSETTICVFMFHKLFSNLKGLFKGKLEYAEMSNAQSEYVICVIDSFLKERGIIIKKEPEIKTNNNIKRKNAKEEYTVKFNHRKEIIERYCYAKPEDLKFEYINPLLVKYIPDVLKEKIPCEKLKKCEHLFFLETVEKYPYIKFITYRINNLRGDYLEIAEKFLLDVPKKLTHTLSHLKILQNLSYKEIGVLLWNNKEINSRPIQSYCEDEHRKVPDEEINRLAKILLVSEDVLRRGYGKIYSDWEEILENPATLDKINKIIDKETHPIELTSDTDKILLLLNQSDEDFYKMIEPYEEDINLYLRKFTEEELKNEYIVIEDEDIDDDLKYYYDYETMYKTALHPEEIDVLISVLEELQAQENN